MQWVYTGLLKINAFAQPMSETAFGVLDWLNWFYVPLPFMLMELAHEPENKSLSKRYQQDGVSAVQCISPSLSLSVPVCLSHI